MTHKLKRAWFHGSFEFFYEESFIKKSKALALSLCECWNINSVTSKQQINQNMQVENRKKKNTIEFYITQLVKVPNFT